MSVLQISHDAVQMDYKNGFALTEMLDGVYPLVKSFRGGLLANNSVVFPPANERFFEVYCFTSGKGYCLTEEKAYNIEELCFFVPDPQTGFTLHASRKIEFTSFRVKMLESDYDEWNETHCCLPLFKTLRDSEPYWQSCKSENTKSWYVICRKLLPRTILGVVRARGTGREGTVESGHANVVQWNIMLEDSDIDLMVDNETVRQLGGDFSFVPAGAPHSLISREGKLNYYIWFEHFVKEINGVSWQP